MSNVNLSLLHALNALLQEESITGAAMRLGISPSAMSRAVAQLREIMNDRLLVRAGADFVLTQRGQDIRNEVAQVVAKAEVLLRPPDALRPDAMDRRFVISAGEGFAEIYSVRLIRRIAREAPRVQLCFTNKLNATSDTLRRGEADVEIGVISDHTAPEIRTRALYRDRFVGAARQGHPLLKGGGTVSLAGYLGVSHVALQRGGMRMGPVDRVLAAAGREREMAVTVTSFSTALSIASESDLVATVPERSTWGLRTGLHVFDLPFDSPAVTVSMMWHPQRDSDPENQWLRNILQDVCGSP